MDGSLIDYLLTPRDGGLGLLRPLGVLIYLSESPAVPVPEGGSSLVGDAPRDRNKKLLAAWGGMPSRPTDLRKRGRPVESEAG